MGAVAAAVELQLAETQISSVWEPGRLSQLNVRWEVAMRSFAGVVTDERTAQGLLWSQCRSRLLQMPGASTLGAAAALVGTVHAVLRHVACVIAYDFNITSASERSAVWELSNGLVYGDEELRRLCETIASLHTSTCQGTAVGSPSTSRGKTSGSDRLRVSDNSSAAATARWLGCQRWARQLPPNVLGVPLEQCVSAAQWSESPVGPPKDLYRRTAAVVAAVAAMPMARVVSKTAGRIGEGLHQDGQWHSSRLLWPTPQARGTL